MFGHRREKEEDLIGTIEVIDELVSFAWNIDWSLCQRKKYGDFVQSPSFCTTSGNSEILTWKLKLYPEGKNRYCRGNMSVYLCAVFDKEKEKSTFYLKDALINTISFHLINTQGDVINKVQEVVSLTHSQSCGLDRFISKDLFKSIGPDILNSGKLTIVCTIATKINSKTEKPPPPLPLKIHRFRSLDNLTCPPPLPPRYYDDDDHEEEKKEEEDVDEQIPRNTFEAMLESGESDVSIITAGRSFCAHRAILSARSNFFQNLFEQDVVQGIRLSVVDMNEFTADVVIELMRYLYLNHVDKLEERASLLLAAANKYQLDKLKNDCQEVMIKDLNVGNASEYLVLSFLHEANKLREKAMEFVVDHSLDVVSTPGFKAIAGSHADVIAAILKTITVKGKAQNQPRPVVQMRKKI